MTLMNGFVIQENIAGVQGEFVFGLLVFLASVFRGFLQV